MTVVYNSCTFGQCAIFHGLVFVFCFFEAAAVGQMCTRLEGEEGGISKPTRINCTAAPLPNPTKDRADSSQAGRWVGRGGVPVLRVRDDNIAEND